MYTFSHSTFRWIVWPYNLDNLERYDHTIWMGAGRHHLIKLDSTTRRNPRKCTTLSYSHENHTQTEGSQASTRSSTRRKGKKYMNITQKGMIIQ
jgi:hypothetical protein